MKTPAEIVLKALAEKIRDTETPNPKLVEQFRLLLTNSVDPQKVADIEKSLKDTQMKLSTQLMDMHLKMQTFEEGFLQLCRATGLEKVDGLTF